MIDPLPLPPGRWLRKHDAMFGPQTIRELAKRIR
jgi:hypothetical protein